MFPLCLGLSLENGTSSERCVSLVFIQNEILVDIEGNLTTKSYYFSVPFKIVTVFYSVLTIAQIKRHKLAEFHRK